jgi:hypothetical protein
VFRLRSLPYSVVPFLVAGLLAACAAAAELPRSGGDGPCVQLLRMPDGDHVVNRCGVCRSVSVERDRPGSSFPRSDTLTLPANGSQRLPYLGPGRTRILGEQPCSGAGPQTAEPAQREAPQCVGLARANGTVGLVNGCRSCRIVAVEETRRTGGSARESFVVAPSSVLPLGRAGATQIEIVRDDPCARSG